MKKIGYWFKALEELGEDAAIEVGLSDWDPKDFKKFPHSEYDGIAMIHAFGKELNPELDYSQINPTIPSRKRIPFFIQFKGFIKYLFTLPLRGKRLKCQRDIGKFKKQEPKKSFIYFTEEETQHCEKIIAQKRISMNAWLIFCLAKAIEPYTKKSHLPQIWMVPISLRDIDIDSYSKSLMTGFVDAYIYPDTQALEIHQRMKKKILNGDAWGGYLGFTFSALLGFYFLKVIIKNNYRAQMRMGVFTNLGKWGNSNLRNNYPKNPVGYAPVVYENPLAAVTITWMGQTLLSLKSHSSLDLEEEDLKNILIEWKKFSLDAS